LWLTRGRRGRLLLSRWTGGAGGTGEDGGIGTGKGEIAKNRPSGLSQLRVLISGYVQDKSIATVVPCCTVCWFWTMHGLQRAAGSWATCQEKKKRGEGGAWEMDASLVRGWEREAERKTT
jgi:hypothetical protein